MNIFAIITLAVAVCVWLYITVVVPYRTSRSKVLNCTLPDWKEDRPKIQIFLTLGNETRKVTYVNWTVDMGSDSEPSPSDWYGSKGPVTYSFGKKLTRLWREQNFNRMLKKNEQLQNT